MPNQRGDDQVMLPFKAKRTFIDAMDEAMRKLGYTNRSQFIRDAIKEKLAEMGIDADGTAPSRVGVGGPKPGVKRTNPPVEERKASLGKFQALAAAPGFADQPEVSLAPPAIVDLADKIETHYRSKLQPRPGAGRPADPARPPTANTPPAKAPRSRRGGSAAAP